VPDQPLEGRRIVVTRPREQATELAERLERLGAVVSVVPLIEIGPTEDPRALDAALDDPGSYDWIVFTSANGVAAVAERLWVSLEGLRVAAVGPATAAAVRALGIEPAFVPGRFGADDIADGLGPLDGAQVLLPQADIADPGLAEELRARGATVNAVAAYRTVEIEPAMSGILPLRVADAIVLASPSAARSLAALSASLEGVRDRPLVACIGPTTARAARGAGLPVGLVADEASAEGIIDALASHFAKST
jgi:uroporphyrinogen III methyltransferase/synthase